MDTPLRLAVPWAKFNVFATDFEFESWAWTKKEMDMIVKRTPLTERATALKALRTIFVRADNKQHAPALPKASGLKPKVAVITLTRNRKAWWANMVANIMSQSWPVSRLEWIIVDDGDEGERLNQEVEEFMEKSPGILVRYVEMTTPKSIGAKRNAGVEAAGEDVEVFVCMDDDDHYPKDSIARRVVWFDRELPTSVKQSQIVYCAVIPMYDLTRYISAMNVSELEAAPAERVSEATMAFTREAWVAKPFPDVSMAEGFGFLEDREEVSVEIPPKGVIVSFIHTGNSSSRRIPKEQEANGCHYGFPNEYFSYVHKIGGGMTD
jgi:glycosyltransferase involved in cell wall biosynthesis